VVEDAPLGIAAAHGAGMAAIGIASTGRTREQLADADLVVDSPAELSPEAVRRLVAPAKTSLGAKTIVYPTPVLVVGTYDPEGRPNIMTAAWGGICCSVPPSVNVSLRKATYSYHSIVHRKAFTVSIPSESQVREADYCGIASGRKEDKFARLGLTAVCSDLVDAPYVQEFPLVLECRLTHTAELGLHTLFAGEIMDVKIDEDVLGPNRLPDLSKLRPLVFAPELRQYFGIGAAVGKAFSIGKT
jgi:flavin reductase (DIM6/NTAB) family NADH-FMN oxidoreductase RutF